MTDYSKLIDAETWTFIRESAKFFPEGAEDNGVEGQRDDYNTMCRAFFRGYPDGVSATDSTLGHVGLRHYTCGEGAAVVMYFHGGGFVVGDLDSHDDVCAEICAETGFDVISVDYRRTPEHKHPAAFDDAMSATKHIAKAFGKPMVLVGDSAGANLAAAVAHAGRGKIDGISGQVLIYPWLGKVTNTGSYLEHANSPTLTRAAILLFSELRGAADDPTYLPLLDTEFSGLPPTYALSAECDPLCDDGRDYVAAVRAASGEAEWVLEHGLVHGYLRGRATVGRVRDSFERIIAAIKDFGTRQPNI